MLGQSLERGTGRKGSEGRGTGEVCDGALRDGLSLIPDVLTWHVKGGDLPSPFMQYEEGQSLSPSHLVRAPPAAAEAMSVARQRVLSMVEKDLFQLREI